MLERWVPKTTFVPDQVLKAVEQIENRCIKCKEDINDDDIIECCSSFGVTMDMSHDGNTLVIGADTYNAKDTDGTVQLGSGAVFVYKRNKSFTACHRDNKKQNNNNKKTYVLQQILVATNPKTGENQVQRGASFGLDLSMSESGARIVVNAVFEEFDEPGSFGAVYVFDQKPNSVKYKPVQKIVRNTEQPFGETVFFGFEVALSGDGNVLSILESPEITLTEPTKTLFYENCATHTTNGTLFVLRQTLDLETIVKGTAVLPQNVSELGRRLKLDQTGNTALIAAPLSTVVDGTGTDISGAGIVFVLNRSVDQRKCKTGVTKWATKQVITSQFPQQNAQFGASLAITPDARFIVVEEPLRDKQQSVSVVENVGLVSVFEQTCTPVMSYILQTELCPSGNDIISSTGPYYKSVVVSSDGGTIAVGYENSTVSGEGQAGVVVIYKRCNGSKRWKQTQILQAFPFPSEKQQFGTGLALSGNGNSLAVGAWLSFETDCVYTFCSQTKQ